MKNKKAILATIVSIGVVGSAVAGSPYQGNRPNLPGSVEAENYDVNGFLDFTSGNQGGKYRNDDVDIETKRHGGYNVGWMDAGEWLEYSVNILDEGEYDIALQVSSPSGGALSGEVYGRTNHQLGNFQVANTGGWQDWQPSSEKRVYLNSGHHTFRFQMNSGAVNFDQFSVIAATSSNDLQAYPGYTGQYAGYTLKLDERFDQFDSSIWAKGDGAVGNESSCRFTQSGVNVDNGELKLVVRNEYVPASWSNDHQSWKGAYNYSCGELRTVPAKRIRFGRIETRMKAPNRNVASGYISSLFTYRHEGNPREWEEIDVELEGGRPDKFQANLIYGLNAADWNSTRQWGAWEDKIVVGPVDDWRVFAIEWTPNAIRWFVDGALMKTLSATDIDCIPNCQWPQTKATPIPDDLTELMMNFWIPNDQIQDVFGGNKYRNQYPMTTQYDWLRIYQLDSHPLQNW